MSWPSGSSAPSVPDLVSAPGPFAATSVTAGALPASAGLAVPPPALPGLWLTRPTLLPLPVAGLAAVQFGAQLVAAALPAFGDLLDGIAHRLEPVQLSRAGATRRGRAALGALA